MLNRCPITMRCLLLAMTCGLPSLAASEPRFAWQQDFARVTETGDIELTQRPFRFVAGQTVRYIDYDNGSVDSPGTKARPWKHHPWDANATGQAAAATATGIDTFIFKGGTIYRGQLTVREQGRPGLPIRLTRDPTWGHGPAIIAGSQVVSGFTRGATHPDIPEPQEVWTATIDFAPRTLWMIARDGTATRIPLARHPNWQAEPEDHRAHWWRWTNEGDAHGPFPATKEWSAVDTVNLKGKPQDFVDGARIYSEFGWVMQTPYPGRVQKFDPATGRVRFDGWNGGVAGAPGKIVFRHMRYYLEDKPHYLDDPNGEFWFDKDTRGGGGTLFVRLPDGANPNDTRLEAGHLRDLIVGSEVRHLEISGLDFRWTSPHWDLTMLSWDFSTKPFGFRPEAHPAAIRLWGHAEDVRIHNCTFKDVVFGINMRPLAKGQKVEDITVEDNVFHNVDDGAVHFTAGAGWGYAHPVGVLDDIKLYRNHAADIGFRPPRESFGTVFNLGSVRRAHIAGNIVERSGGQGINVLGGKISGKRGDIPLVRVLIHQNKVWKTMQNADDYGGIEVWQHGPFYIYNNLSHDARGMQDYKRRFHGQSPGFAHAYYLDGGFKSYLFNNIAWGLSNDPTTNLVNCSAFQEIYSFQNMFLNNTAYNFAQGSRRQRPEAGRNKFLGNVFQDISSWVFFHNQPARTLIAPNAADVGQQRDKVDFGTNAYDRNVFHSFSNCPHEKSGFASYLPDGSWIADPEQFQEMLQLTDSMSAGLGVEDRHKPLQDPTHGDFRLASGSAGIDNGAVAFVPWALHGVVAEWNFYPRGSDHTDIIDEHWYAREFMAGRNDYHKRPTYPLTAKNIEPGDYIDGPLENFTRGALRLNPARKTYATISHTRLNEPFTISLPTRARHGQDPGMQDTTFTGDDLKTASIHTSNFLIEVYFKATGDGLLISKKQGAGYDLRIHDGRVVFSVADAGGAQATVTSRARVHNGQWRHLIAEIDRSARTMTLYIDGKQDASGQGIGDTSLANDADLYVGGTPTGDHLDGTLEFMRIARGTLADAHTTIEELYAWQFDGPFLRDMRGAEPKGRGRDAGAIESH